MGKPNGMQKEKTLLILENRDLGQLHAACFIKYQKILHIMYNITPCDTTHTFFVFLNFIELSTQNLVGQASVSSFLNSLLN